MKEIIIDNYLLIKALHIIAVISWMAGMLYLPRLFVYHAGLPKHSQEAKLLIIMENRLLKIIINPAMVATYILGLFMIWAMGFSSFGKWLHIKLLLVLAMSIIHAILASHLKRFRQNNNNKSQTYFRILNEVPTLLLIGIVILAVTKPL